MKKLLIALGLSLALLGSFPAVAQECVNVQALSAEADKAKEQGAGDYVVKKLEVGEAKAFLAHAGAPGVEGATIALYEFPGVEKTYVAVLNAEGCMVLSAILPTQVVKGIINRIDAGLDNTSQ